MEEDELISDKEDEKVRGGSRLIVRRLHPLQATAAQSKKQATAERQQKKQKRKVAEGQLQIKRKEMDKAKVRCPSFHFRPLK
jgi:SWI/SNF-related matrix-associated actin-dependent regulator of chromatin subfamily A member 5